MSDIVIIDYGSGNLRSVARALLAVSEKRRVDVSDDPRKISDASHLILPGVGAFDACKRQLYLKTRTLEALIGAVCKQAKPFLGICVGMQLMAKYGLEYGKTEGLGWVQGESRKLSGIEGLTIPHMGWDNLKVWQAHPLFTPLDNQDVYFAHSFALYDVERAHIAMSCFYGEDFCAALACDNMIGTQFHPEKSQKVGLAFLQRFLGWSQ